MNVSAQQTAAVMNSIQPFTEIKRDTQRYCGYIFNVIYLSLMNASPNSFTSHILFHSR